MVSIKIRRLYDSGQRSRPLVFSGNFRLHPVTLRGTANYHQLERTFRDGYIEGTLNPQDVHILLHNLNVRLNGIKVWKEDILGGGRHLLEIGNLKYELEIEISTE